MVGSTRGIALQPGDRFGRLTVIERADRPHYWRVKCDCGTEAIVLGWRMVNDQTKSCGCLRKYYSQNYRSRGRLRALRLNRPGEFDDFDPDLGLP